MSTTTGTTAPAGPMRHDEAVVTVATALVWVYRAGSGPTLVLLHGGGRDDAQLSWAPLWPALTGHAQLLAPDLPGHGGSPLGHTEPTPVGYRRWLLAFLDAVGIQQAVVVGLSLGGGIARRAALDAPTRVAGLVGLAPCGISPRVPHRKLGDVAVHTPHADRLLRASLGALLRPEVVSDELVAQVRALLARLDAQAAWAACQHHEVEWTRPRSYLAGQLAGIGCPVLLLSGAHDGLVPPQDVRAAAARIPHARFVLVAGAGHWLPRDTPAQVTNQLRGFLTPRPRAPRPVIPVVPGMPALPPAATLPHRPRLDLCHPVKGPFSPGFSLLTREFVRTDPANRMVLRLDPGGVPWPRTRLTSTPRTKP